MNILSQDLRRRILNYALNSSVRKTARTFQVSPTTVHALKKLYFQTGSLQPRVPKAVNRRAICPEGELYLQLLLREDPDATLEELCERYAQTYGVQVCIATMHNTLKRMGISYKKNLPRSETGQRHGPGQASRIQPTNREHPTGKPTLP